MKFTNTVTINQPLDRVVELFKDPNNLQHWQEGFVSHELLSGDPGAPGSKSRFVYLHRKKTFELLEIIEVNDLPKEFIARYEHIHMTNTMANRFTALSENSTRLDTEVHYTEFRGFMIKMIAFFIPGMFKKQVQKWLDRFKAFAER